MGRTDDYQTPRWTTLGLGIGFLALVVIGIVTVLLPELQDDPTDPDTSTEEPANSGESEDE